MLNKKKYSLWECLHSEENIKTLLAKDNVNNKKVIIRYYSKDFINKSKFADNFLFSREITHPNLIKIIDTGYENNSFYYVTPFYETIDPSEYCKQKGEPALLKIFWELLKPIHYLSKRNLLSGLISLKNLLIYKENNDIKIKLIKVSETSLVNISDIAYFAPPELITNQINESYSIQTIIYSLGKLLLYLISNDKTVFENDIVKILKNNLKQNFDNFTPSFKLDAGILEIIKQMIANDISERYKNTTEIIRDLLPYLKKHKINFNNTQKITTTLYRKKLIDSIGQSLEKTQELYIYGKNDLSDISYFLKIKLNFKGYYVYHLKQKYINTKKLYEEIAYENPETPINSLSNDKIIIFVNAEIYDKKIIKENPGIKCLIISKEDISEKQGIRKFKIPMFTNEEVEKLFDLIFGKNVLPPEIETFIKNNANKNDELIKKIINILQRTKAIRVNELSYYFFPENLPSDLSQYDEIKDKIEVLKHLNGTEREYLERMAFWKNSFTNKELNIIFGLSLVKLQTIVNKLKQLDILIKNSHYIEIKYKFLKNYLIENTPEKKQYEIKERIINYLFDKNKSDLQENLMLLLYLKDNKHYKELLKNAINLFDKYQKSNLKDFLFEVGQIAWEVKKELLKINPCDALYLIFHYLNTTDTKDLLDLQQDILNFLEKNIKKCDDPYYEMQLYLKKLLFYQHQKKYEKIVDYYEKNSSYIVTWEEIIKLRLHYLVSNAYYILGNISKAIEIINLFIETVKSNEEYKKSYLAAGYGKLAFYFYRLDDYDKALRFYNKAIIISEKYDRYLDLGYLYSRIAFINFELLKLDKAKEYYKKADKINNKFKNTYFMGLISNGMGHIKIHEGKYWDALKYFFKNKKDSKIIKENFSPHMYARTLFLIGYEKQAQFFLKQAYKNKARKTYLQYFRSIDLSILYFKKNKTKFLNLLKTIRDEINENKYTPFKYYYFFNACHNFESGKYDNMKSIIDEMKQNLNFMFPENDIYYHFLLSLYYWKTNNLKKALANANKTMEQMEKVNNNIIFAPQFYHQYYLMFQDAYKKDLVTKNYKKYLEKAYGIINKRKNNLPTNQMRRVYINQNRIKKIVDAYSAETKFSKSEKTSVFLLEMIEKLSKIITTVTDKNKLFNKILEIALKATNTQRGIIFTLNENTNEPEVSYQFQIADSSLKDIENINKNIIKNVFDKKKAVYYTNVFSNKMFDEYKSFADLKIESIICLPLVFQNKVLGTIYLDSKGLNTLSTEELRFLNIFSQIAVSAIKTSHNYVQLKNEKKELINYFSSEHKVGKKIIGNSPQMIKVFEDIKKIAPTNVNVLIEGESGTGKELIAKELHNLSNRKDKIFIPIDCGSLSETIIESELFGHIKGSFTGAVNDKKGLFEEADGGTVFLDEISNISFNIQIKLLRLIQEGEFKRVGENNIRKANVRLIVASNKPLSELVEEGKFRKDLYYRLSVFPIKLPPLREREGDITLLAFYFLNYYNNVHSKNISDISSEALSILNQYIWPGNIRELQNEMERAVIICNEDIITDKYFLHLKQANSVYSDSLNFKEDFATMVANFKISVIENALQKSGNNWTKAAKLLGLSRQNLRQIYQRNKKDF